MFELHPQLANDTVVVGYFKLSVVLLHKDSRYPWCVLVPQREGLEELFHLDEADQVQLIKESSHLCTVMHDIFAPYKMNIASLGNIVPQLHVHHVARFKEDAAWPGPVWGVGSAEPYAEAELNKRVERLRHALGGEGFSAFAEV